MRKTVSFSPALVFPPLLRNLVNTCGCVKSVKKVCFAVSNFIPRLENKSKNNEKGLRCWESMLKYRQGTIGSVVMTTHHLLQQQNTYIYRGSRVIPDTDFEARYRISSFQKAGSEYPVVARYRISGRIS